MLPVFRYDLDIVGEGDFRIRDIRMPRLFPLAGVVILVADVDQQLHLLFYRNLSPARQDIVIRAVGLTAIWASQYLSKRPQA